MRYKTAIKTAEELAPGDKFKTHLAGQVFEVVEVNPYSTHSVMVKTTHSKATGGPETVLDNKMEVTVTDAPPHGVSNPWFAPCSATKFCRPYGTPGYRPIITQNGETVWEGNVVGSQGQAQHMADNKLAKVI